MENNNYNKQHNKSEHSNRSYYEHKHSSQSSKEYKSHKHHSAKYSKKYHDSSSEMERRGKNIIYHEVKKQRVFENIKRVIFILLIMFIIIFSIFIISNPEYNVQMSNEKRDTVTYEEFYDLKTRLFEYEDRIEALEEKIDELTE